MNIPLMTWDIFWVLLAPTVFFGFLYLVIKVNVKEEYEVSMCRVCEKQSYSVKREFDVPVIGRIAKGIAAMGLSALLGRNPFESAADGTQEVLQNKVTKVVCVRCEKEWDYVGYKEIRVRNCPGRSPQLGIIFAIFCVILAFWGFMKFCVFAAGVLPPLQD